MGVAGELIVARRRRCAASPPPRPSISPRKPHARGPCYYSDRLLADTRIVTRRDCPARPARRRRGAPGHDLDRRAVHCPRQQSTVPVNDEFFETRIRPVLSSRCYACHSSRIAAPKGELVLDTKAGVLKGGRLGPAVVPGKPADSKLLEALTYANAHLQMPPSGKLADPIIADFERWIAGGAPDPRTETVTAAGPGKRVVGESELAKGRQWWAFQAVRELPTDALRAMADKSTDARLVASHDVKVRTKLDRFVLAKLAEKGLTPSPEADARTLIRRASIDLIGLKPTYDEVEAYAADPSPDKYEKLVDRLLASPQYGERWARYWLDVVRYAEDNPGNITNPPYPHAWRYRDWVIESLNKDVPYDRFVKLQLAADLMPSTPRSDLRALGIIALGPQDHKDVRLSVDVVGTIQLNDWDERLDAVSRGLLGLSVACARCHDHKFDPIQQKDYYRLAQRLRIDTARPAPVLRHRS